MPPVCCRRLGAADTGIRFSLAFTRYVLLPFLHLPQREWHVLLYGANHTLQQDPRFQLCRSGVVFSDSALTSQVFRFAGCIVDLAAGPEQIGGKL